MSCKYDNYMQIAFDEACLSLREGNHGFGAVIIDVDGKEIARARDRERTEGDPTSHAEMNAIRAASKVLGHDLDGCAIISTHEPCPMCATAILWSGISTIAYGYSIEESLKEGRRRIDLGCKEIFERAGRDAAFMENVLHERCALLYRRDVRDEIKRIRGKSIEELGCLGDALKDKRLGWFEREYAGRARGDDIVEAGYGLLLAKLGIKAEEAPIVEKTRDKIVFHSMNYCPTLEACKILGYDTRTVCENVSEKATDALLKALDGRLSFRRNYDKLRPNSEYCEEMIVEGRPS